MFRNVLEDYVRECLTRRRSAVASSTGPNICAKLKRKLETQVTIMSAEGISRRSLFHSPELQISLAPESDYGDTALHRSGWNASGIAGEVWAAWAAESQLVYPT